VRKLAVIVALSLLAACSRDIQNADAVRGSIIDYLKARQAKNELDVDMDKMQIEVSNLSFSSSGKEAHASVKFTTLDGKGAMKLPYTLDRKGDKWVVRGHAEGGENPHGASGLPTLPPQHPPVDKQP
jgi:hypothetical protein